MSLLSDDYLRSRSVIALVEPGSERIRRADGRSAPIPTDQQRWTTPDMMETERLLIGMATKPIRDRARFGRSLRPTPRVSVRG